MRYFDYFCSENFSESLLEKIRIMTTNEIVGRLKAGGLDASSTNRGAAVYVTEARTGRAEPGWFGFRIVCDSEATERRVRSILSRFYYIEASGNVWRLKSRNRVPLMAIRRGGVPPTPPTPPTPSDGPLYFEAVEANSTVSLMSTLPTAPDLEYSEDGETWQEWQHTTVTEDEITTHTFDTLTLTAVGDRVYLRGDNPNGLADITEDDYFSYFAAANGSVISGGNIMSLLDKSMQLTEVPVFGFIYLFNEFPIITAPSMSAITDIGGRACSGMFSGCTLLTSAADMPSLSTIEEEGLAEMYSGCIFDMSDDGTTFNFAFGATPPVTAGEETFSTYYDIAQWMSNTNGFTEP